MKIQLNSNHEHLFILGAGSSVEYGLPTWEKLSALVVQKVNESREEHLEHKNEILSWLDKVGKNKEYDTIDRCITKESRSKEFRSNGLTVENHIFLIMKDIFKGLYKENEDGWISGLNQKILDGKVSEDQIAFINYNYDHVLDENLLHFDYLTQKAREYDYGTRISYLSPKYIPAFYPHGNFFSENELSRPSHLYRNIETKKSNIGNVVNAISCHDSETHAIKKHGSTSIKLYILGLGGGLQGNLGKLTPNYPVSEIHVTIREKNEKDEILKFLGNNYGISTTEIRVYADCGELVENAFDN
jgi:hypothetical protein